MQIFPEAAAYAGVGSTYPRDLRCRRRSRREYEPPGKDRMGFSRPPACPARRPSQQARARKGALAANRSLQAIWMKSQPCFLPKEIFYLFKDAGQRGLCHKPRRHGQALLAQKSGIEHLGLIPRSIIAEHGNDRVAGAEILRNANSARNVHPA